MDFVPTPVEPTASLLQGKTNYLGWSRKTQSNLSSQGLIEYITKDLSTIKSEIIQLYAAGGDNLSSTDKIRRASALKQAENRMHQVHGIIYNSLSDSSQIRIPESILDFENPDPKALWDWLKTDCGTGSGIRQAELWLEACEIKTEENVSPGDNMARMSAIINEISKASKGQSLEKFLEKTKIYLMLNTLPYSFATTAEQLYPTDTHTPEPEDIIKAVDAVWHRRVKNDMAVDYKGMVAKKVDVKKGDKRDENGRRLGRNGEPLLGQDPNKFCSPCDRYGHDGDNCYRSKRAGKGGGKKAMVAKEEEFVLDAASDGDSDESIGTHIAVRESALLVSTGSADQPVVVVDSGATDHFIRDYHLLSNVVPLPDSIQIQIGDGQYVNTIAKGDTKIGRLNIVGAYHVPDL